MHTITKKRLTIKKVFDLFSKYAQYDSEFKMYYFSGKNGKKITSNDTRELYCFFQIYLKNEFDFIFVYDLSKEEKEKYLND